MGYSGIIVLAYGDFIKGCYLMRKIMNFRLFSLLIVFSIIMLSGPSDIYSQGDIYDVFGYEEDVADFTISNVVDTFDASLIDKAFDAGLVAEAPVEIVLENEGGSSFAAYRLEKTDSGIYGYNPDEPLAIAGEVSTMIPIEGAEKNIFGQYSPDDLEEVTLDLNELGNYEYQELTYLPGGKIILEESGDYYILFRIKATMGATEAFVKVVNTEEEFEENQNHEEEPPIPVEAIPSNARILVDGDEIAFDAYNINGNNYFKLRDLAYILSESQKRFDVTWKAEERIIGIISDTSYTPIGGEMQVEKTDQTTGVLNVDPIQMDGEEIKLLAYNIGGNNYFKLRDIANQLDFGVSWEADSKTVIINTDNSYIEDIPQKQAL